MTSIYSCSKLCIIFRNFTQYRDNLTILLFNNNYKNVNCCIFKIGIVSVWSFIFNLLFVTEWFKIKIVGKSIIAKFYLLIFFALSDELYIYFLILYILFVQMDEMINSSILSCSLFINLSDLRMHAYALCVISCYLATMRFKN